MKHIKLYEEFNNSLNESTTSKIKAQLDADVKDANDGYKYKSSAVYHRIFGGDEGNTIITNENEYSAEVLEYAASLLEKNGISIVEKTDKKLAIRLNGNKKHTYLYTYQYADGRWCVRIDDFKRTAGMDIYEFVWACIGRAKRQRAGIK